MARVKIIFPSASPLYQTSVPVRIGDVNYGGHLGNDAVLSIVHEARMQMLAAWGFTELDCGGSGLIMADTSIAYRAEAYYGDVIEISLFADEISRRSFRLLYLLQAKQAGTTVDIAYVQTGMVSYDYSLRKSVGIPPALAKFLSSAV